MQKHQISNIPVFKWLLPFLFASGFATGSTSCTSSKLNATYFATLPKDTLLNNVVTKDFEVTIAKGDVLNIAVSSLSLENSALFNAPPLAVNSSGSASGYAVDLSGNILYPKLGTIHVEGISPAALRDRLLQDLLPYLKEPLVIITFQNHKVVVMGEVNKVLNMPDDYMTILEALTLSGGLPLTGRKDNILVIRENGANKQFKRLNLNNSSIFTSPFYYLRPNDIVYVEPDLTKNNSGKKQQIIGYISAAVSFAIIIIDRIIK